VLTLAEAIRRWLEGGAAADVVLAGGDTTWRGQRMSSRLLTTLGPHAPATRLTGALDERALSEELDRADLVALPSLYENFPYACLEAMARAKPVLATRGSGFDEILQHGRSGVLVPPGDPDSLADALATWAHDREGLGALGEEARRVVQRFAAPQIVAQLCSAYTRGARRHMPPERHRPAAGPPGPPEDP